MNRVTVIMPVYNAAKYVKKAIDSILNQTYRNFILLCIDDCSTDNSVEIIEKITDERVKLLKNNQNMGISYTRNIGLEHADTEYIALLDNDDIAMPYRLEYEVKYLDDNPDVDVVGGHQRQIDKNGDDIDKQWSVPLNPKYVKAYLLFNNAVVNGSTMFRKEFVDRYNIRYKENMCGAEDFMFWVECSLHGKIKNLDKVFLLWRVTGQNETINMTDNHYDERTNALCRIKNFALDSSGFILEESEKKLLGKIFNEEGQPDNVDEIRALFKILKKISLQAYELNLDNAKEINIMCRKRFGEKVGKAFFLWE